jgi:hypothetical protein
MVNSIIAKRGTIRHSESDTTESQTRDGIVRLLTMYALEGVRIECERPQVDCASSKNDNKIAWQTARKKTK